MWVFTKYGFFSSVCARKGDGSHSQPPDPNRIMIRTRVREHLEMLIEAFPAELSGRDIVETPHSDYRFRLFVEKPVWVKVAAGLANETDYDNFKSKVGHFQDKKEPDYEHALHEVWNIMHALQEKVAKPPPAGADGAPASARDLEEEMKRLHVKPARKSDSGNFRFDEGDQFLSGRGKTRTILGYGFNSAGEEVYLIRMHESGTVDAKRAYKAHKEYTNR